jgi:hypothetical protein
MKETLLVLAILSVVVFIVITAISRIENRTKELAEISKKIVKVDEYDFDVYFYKGIVVGQFDNTRKSFCLRFDSAWDLNLSPNKFFDKPEEVFEYAFREASLVKLKQVYNKKPQYV